MIDAEGALKDYLRSDAEVIASAAGTRTFLRAKNGTQFPYIEVTRIGGSEDTSNAPIDAALMQIDVFGRVRQLGECTAVRGAVRSALRRLDDTSFTSPGKGRILGASVSDDRRFPEPEAQDADGTVGERPRYVITATVVVAESA